MVVSGIYWPIQIKISLNKVSVVSWYKLALFDPTGKIEVINRESFVKAGLPCTSSN